MTTTYRATRRPRRGQTVALERAVREVVGRPEPARLTCAACSCAMSPPRSVCDPLTTCPSCGQRQLCEIGEWTGEADQPGEPSGISKDGTA